MTDRRSRPTSVAEAARADPIDAPRRRRHGRPRITTTGISNDEAGDVGVPGVGVPALRRPHLHLPALQGPGRRRGPTPARPLRHPVHVDHVVRAADELAHHGAGRRRPSSAATTAALRIWLARPPPCSARSSSPARSTSSPCSCTRAWASPPTPPSSAFYTLTGFHGVHVTLGIIMLLSMLLLSLRGRIPRAPGRGRRDRRPVLALRRRGVGRDLHHRLPDQVKGRT